MERTPDTDDPATPWLPRGGAMGAAIRAMDWSRTPLGPLEAWPQSLRVAVGICLNSRFPMFVWWGPALVNIYNDAYAPILGERHPQALGRPARAIWGEIWDVVGPQADAVMLRGEATWNERVMLVMERHGYTEEAYFTWSYSPISDETGAIAGVFCACTEDTARIAAERERDRLAAQRQLALDAARMGWWHFDPATKLSSWDARYAEIFGVTGRARPNDEILARLHPDDVAGVWAAVEAALDPADPKPYSTEYRVRHDDGAVRWVEAHGVATFSGEGAARRAVSFVGTVVDVTERKQIEERPRAILESISDAFFAVDRAWRFTYVNRQANVVLGFTPGAVLGRSLWDVFPGLEDTEFGRAYHRAARERVAVSFTSFYAEHDRWYEVHAYPSPDGVSVYFRDVSERKRAELVRDALVARDRFLIGLDNATRVLSDAGEILAVSVRLLGEHLGVDRCAFADVEDDQTTFSVRGEYTRGVPATVGSYAMTQFGAAFAEWMRRGEAFVVDDAEADPRLADVRDAYRAARIAATANAPLSKSGRIVALIAIHQSAPRRWQPDEVNLLQVVGNRCWESLQRARVERSLRRALEAEQRARAAAEQASRMKDEFLATLSHELRTPLNAILGWSQIASRNPANAATLDRALDTIERNARAQAQIIEDLLDMSGIISGKVRLDVRSLDLEAVVQGAVETSRPAAEARGVELRAALEPLGATVAGDSGRLQQVMWNLLSNAVKFTPRGGTVDVLLSRNGAEAEVHVVDSGEGIPREFLPHVFDRFRQADGSTTRAHGGLGLGLSIVKQLVELHGGRVAAYSAGPGRGAEVVVTLPLAAEVSQAAPDPRRAARDFADAAALRADAHRIAGVRVLVVDDEPDALALVRYVLEDGGALVSTATTAADAVARVEADRPDVLVSDIGMPGEDGYALIARVRALGAERGGAVPAIALTAYARGEDRLRATSAGFQMHASKPLEPADLVAMVASLADRTER